MTITLRQESQTGATTKGDSLTFAELDNNFIDLLTNKIQQLQVDADTGSVTLGEAQSNGVFTVIGGTNVTTSVTEDSAGNASLTIDATDTGITDVVSDTTPQLGGNLDVNGNSIVSVSNGNIPITPNGTGQVQTTNLRYDEDIHDLGTTGGTITPDVANGNVQTITLNNNLTFSAFSNPIAGQSLTLIIDTNGTSRTLTSTMKFAGGNKTMSTTDTFDIMTVFYDGTNYFANYVTNFS